MIKKLSKAAALTALLGWQAIPSNNLLASSDSRERSTPSNSYSASTESHASVQLIDGFNNLIEMQEKAVEVYKERKIFGVKKNNQYQWMNYGEFGSAVNHLRSGLATLDLQKGDRVAIIADNSPQWAISCYASLGLGGVFVPMYTDQNPEDWRYTLEDSKAKMLFVTDRAILEKVLTFSSELEHLEHIILMNGEDDPNAVHLNDLMENGKTAAVPSVHVDPEDLMGLVYTSGTTGNPKGVMLTHKNITSTLQGLPQAIEITDEKSLSFLPWAHIFGQLGELHALLFLGNSTGFAENKKTIVSNIGEVQPTILFSVPVVFNRLYDKVNAEVAKSFLKKKLYKNWQKYSDRQRKNVQNGFFSKVFAKVFAKKIKSKFGGKLKYAVSGGAKLDKTVGQFMSDLGITVLEGYGMSETSGIISLNTLKENKLGSVGKAFPGVEIRIDLVNSPYKEKNEGEIIVCGPNIMKGYYNLEEKTKETLTEEGCLKTGDVGKLDDDGYLFITGRVKDIYKLKNGKYVVPGVFEAEAKLHPFVSNAYLYGQDQDYNIAILSADMQQIREAAKSEKINLSSLSDEEVLKNKKVLEFLKEAAEDIKKNVKKPFYQPKKVRFVAEEWNQENGLLTPTMKVKRPVIYRHYQELIESMY